MLLTKPATKEKLKSKLPECGWASGDAIAARRSRVTGGAASDAACFPATSREELVMIVGRIIGIGAVVLAVGLMATPAANASTSVSVPANAAAGVSTLSVVAGDSITISASGSAGYGYEGTAPCVGYPTTQPNGSRYIGSTNCGPKDDPNAALSGNAIGLLIARIGGGAWFAVGTSSTFTAAASGTLTVAYNDSVYSDNTGSYSATVTDSGGGGGGCHHCCDRARTCPL